MVAHFQQMRALLVDVHATYQALEQVAVQLGAAPPGPGSRQLTAGSWSYASWVLSGDCPPPGMVENPLRRRFDPSRVVSTPSNTSRQPLGLTTRMVGR